MRKYDCGDRPATPDDGVTIDVITKNRRERIRVALREFKGTEFVDCRVYIELDHEWRATTKGLAVRPELLSRLIGALREAEREAMRRGLLVVTPEPANVSRPH